jgi:hypothetical protein
MPDQGTCRGCGRPILWVLTTAGNRMPLDRSPTERGNVDISSGVAVVVSQGQGGGAPLYLSHHATCPHAAQYRETKKDKVCS